MMTAEKARSQVMIAKANGSLVPLPCEECGTRVNVEAHHLDYRKPLAVKWFCKTHHVEAHVDLRKIGMVRRVPFGFTQFKLTDKAHKALKGISLSTGLKMWAALEQAVLEKAAALKAGKAAQS